MVLFSKCESHRVLYCSLNSLCFLSELLSGVMGCEHTQQHCLQTPGRDDVTLQEHMFFTYARPSSCARSRFYRNSLCLAFKRQSACWSREWSFSRSERLNKRVCFHDLHTHNTCRRRWGLWGNLRLQTWRGVKHGVDFNGIYSVFKISGLFHSEIHFLVSKDTIRYTFMKIDACRVRMWTRIYKMDDELKPIIAY